MMPSAETGHYDSIGLASRLLAAISEAGMAGRRLAPAGLAPPKPGRNLVEARVGLQQAVPTRT